MSDAATSSAASVSQWLDQLRAGDQEGAQELWHRYFQQLVGLARAKLQGRRPVLGDPEDVALSAFNSFCQGAEVGRFPRLDDRDDLWQVLVMLTERKAWRVLKHESRQKRGAGLQRVAFDAECLLGKEPTPQFAAQLTEECQRLLTLLDKDDLREVALWKMEGYMNEEIAAKRSCALRTIERKLKTIRALWKAEHKS